MKINSFIYILLMTFLWEANFISAQNKNNSGGGEYFLPIEEECFSESQRLEIIQQNKVSIESLRKQGKIGKISGANSASFGWPLKLKDGIDDPGFYGISNFVDHNSTIGQRLDYNGGKRTYDLDNGYNHKGTDIFLWPFSWYKMDNDEVEIVAVEDGTIIGKYDGNDDRSCGLGNANWNAVYVLHSSGYTAWYGHMKKNSLTSKDLGQLVNKGEYLGIVGSSGSSTGPHLHLEVYDVNNKLIDPWAGQYNPTTSASLWENQKPYYDSKINKIATHGKPPLFPSCPGQEIPNYKNQFMPGDTIYFITYYQDQLKNQLTNFTVYTPESIVQYQWSHVMQYEYYQASYWYWWFVLPSNASLGEWSFAVQYLGNLYYHDFIVSNSTTAIDYNIDLENSFTLSNNYPNPFNPSTKISYQVAKESFVTIELFDMLGRKVKDLFSANTSQGIYELTIDGSDLTSGAYFVTMKAGNFVNTKKITLVK